jgi:UDPglucose 6-dehydrogenase
LDAGIGYGGSCFPKDVDAFIRLSEKSGYEFKLLREVRDVNEHQKQSFVRLIEEKLWNLHGKTIGVLGLAFKANTDDMRSAASIDIITALQKEGAKIKAYDPKAVENAKKMFKGITYCSDPYAVARGCDCLLLLTEWDEFRKIDMSKISQSMRQAVLFDGRNFFDRREMEQAGFEYFGIGRGR